MNDNEKPSIEDKIVIKTAFFHSPFKKSREAGKNANPVIGFINEKTIDDIMEKLIYDE